MPIPVICPSCSTKLRAPDTMAGYKTKCPKCGIAVVIPSPVHLASELACAEPMPQAVPAAAPQSTAPSVPRRKKSVSAWVTVPILLIAGIVVVIVNQYVGPNAELNRGLEESRRLHEQMMEQMAREHIETYEELGIVRHCPHCREKIKWGATKCPFCRSDLEPTESADAR